MEFLSKMPALSRFLGLKDLRSSIALRIVIGLLLLVYFTLLFPTTESIEETYHVGSVWTSADLIAPFSFPVYRDAREYAREQLRAAASVWPVVVSENDVDAARRDTLERLLSTVDLATAARQQWLKKKSRADSLEFDLRAGELPFGLNAKQWSALQTVRASDLSHGKKPLSGLDEQLRKNLADLLKPGILDSAGIRERHDTLAVRREQFETLVPSNQIFDLNGARMQAHMRMVD